MIGTLVQLELLLLERMNREQLIAALLERHNCVPFEITGESLTRYSTDALQMLLLAARLTYVVRRQNPQNLATP
jgi:hypothetical protein